MSRKLRPNTESQNFKVNTAATFGPVASSPTLLGELGPHVRPQLGKGPDDTAKQYAWLFPSGGSFVSCEVHNLTFYGLLSTTANQSPGFEIHDTFFTRQVLTWYFEQAFQSKGSYGPQLSRGMWIQMGWRMWLRPCYHLVRLHPLQKNSSWRGSFRCGERIKRQRYPFILHFYFRYVI